jgi:MinD superfamily P-loop ATPase
MKIAITGGKGGTGKSTIATALAMELAKHKKTMLVDADVDCPNDHLILNIKKEKINEVFQPIPKFDLSKCKKCGRCAEVCKQHAIVFIEGNYPILIPEQCIGCSTCKLACPHNAINLDKKKIGTLYKGKKNNLDFLSGETEIGVEEESPIVNALKKEILFYEKDYDYILIDSSPGIHCNVISALQDCDIALCVTEPTPLGAHDLKLNLELLNILKIPAFIVLNKSTIGKKEIIEKLAKKSNIKIISEIPYDKEIIKDYSSGKPIKIVSIQKIIKFLEKMENGK